MRLVKDRRVVATTESVLAQTVSDWEIVIVDNRSKDDTLSVRAV